MSVLDTDESMEDISETVLIALAIKRELPAMEELIRRQHNNVRNFMLRLCQHREEAEDLSQQVFLKLWQSIDKLKSVKTYYGWQKQIMINVWKESLRNRKIRFDESELSEEIEEIADTVKDQALEMDLTSALAALSPPMRLCVLLAYHDGLSHPEISALTGIAMGTVKSNISRGTRKLKVLLAGYLPDHQDERGKSDER